MKSFFLPVALSLVLLSACTSQPAPAASVIPTPGVPAPSATSTPLGGAQAVASPSPTATSAPSPTPTFTPTPQPDQALREARQAMRDGDFGTAIQKYQAVIDGSATPDQIEEALVNRAVATARSGDPACRDRSLHAIHRAASQIRSSRRGVVSTRPNCTSIARRGKTRSRLIRTISNCAAISWPIM